MAHEHEAASAAGHGNSRTTPKDFFLWTGIIIALYGSVTSMVTLLFQYISFAYPDPLTGPSDPYAASTHVAMATVIVLVPTTLVLYRIMRSQCAKDPSRMHTWVRRWALVLTIFIAAVAMLIDLITLITTFLGGELTVRFIFKVVIVLLSAGGVFLHFLADIKGYWAKERQRANTVGYAFGFLAIITVVAGFLVIGTPSETRGYKLDQQRVYDLENIQSQVVSYWQEQRKLPAGLAALNDPLSNMIVPMDPETGSQYEYATTSPLSFSLCATFDQPSWSAQQSVAPRYGDGQNFSHGVGHACFTRTIDPVKYPPITSSVKQ